MGNEVWEFRHERVDHRLRFEVRLCVETESGPACVPADPGESPGDRRFLSQTRLVDDSPALRAAARNLWRAGRDGWEQVTAVGRWVYERMAYRPGVTGIETTAAAALELGQGVCQDYAHVMLALCRSLAIPARYVSGFIPGEGYMHAWVEALVPHPGRSEPCWTGYDPTHCRAADAEYLAVASGRDFADVSPVTGAFYGDRPGRLTSWCQVIQVAPRSVLRAPRRSTSASCQA
jgi:transglutaminase-like putative cysteine protease